MNSHLGPDWDDSSKAILTAEWRKGTLGKVIGMMLDPPRSQTSIQHQRRRMKLPPRRAGNLKETRMNLYMPRGLRERMELRAFSAGRTPSAYIRRLIERDLAASP